MHRLTLKYRNVMGALTLLLLFTTYQAGVMAFTHVHIVNGVYIAHSHPYGDNHHQHSRSALLVIHQLDHFTSVVPVVMVCQQPTYTWVCRLETPRKVSTRQGTRQRIPQLRAPPRTDYKL